MVDRIEIDGVEKFAASRETIHQEYLYAFQPYLIVCKRSIRVAIVISDH